MRGTLFTVGLGPGDPDLMTVKAARIIATAPVIAYFAKRGRAGHARGIVEGHTHPAAEELRLEYPFTTEIALDDPRYAEGIGAFYESCAARVAESLDAGQDVALLCEGDPFFYGSAMYVFDRLAAARARPASRRARHRSRAPARPPAPPPRESWRGCAPLS